ncbi:MAG: ADP-ribosylglycohydrolase family protein [Clostridiales bacterium]|nr:ADP-ribosylglycohydrolase family protein [Clostridiales bacterium]
MSGKKAWEYEAEWIRAAVPPQLAQDDNEEDWMSYVKNGNYSDEQLLIDWYSEVPGSKAPCHLVVAAIQCMRDRGFDVSEAESYIEEGLEAAARQDAAGLQKITARIYHCLNTAKPDDSSDYRKDAVYQTFRDVEEKVKFEKAAAYDVNSPDFERRIRAGWLGQLVGGCLGTQIEGYTTENIRRRFGEIRGYLRKPETYNDDITYELAYLDGFARKGYDITSEDVAYQWLEMIADGYSAEKIALANLRRGIMPPESGRCGNYFSDWIGAQMRTPLHGMLAPGDARLAARLAADDSVVSHSNNGMLGGIFNAVLVSHCFTEKQMRTALEKTVECIPHDSQYYAVVRSALDLCRKGKGWEADWDLCQEKYKNYNWIHAYPNAAAEIIALWYGDMDFDETCHIIAMEGQDADCTAAPILNALAVMTGPDAIDERWTKPIGDTVYTMMRGLRKVSIDALCTQTCEAVRAARRRR